MPQSASTAPSTSPPSFAGLLASFAAPGQKKPPARELGRDTGRDTGREADGLEDDVATLSYERALRAHARYHAPGETPPPSERPMAAVAEPRPFAVHAPAKTETIRIFEQVPVQAGSSASAIREAPLPAPQFAADAVAEPVQTAEPAAVPFAGLARNLKNVSITIRVSQSECTQLRRRAAEAGLTVSAYLRSCTFETEALRALVKDTLAKMRTDGSGEGNGDRLMDRSEAREKQHSWWRELLARLWPHGRVNPHVAEA